VVVAVVASSGSDNGNNDNDNDNDNLNPPVIQGERETKQDKSVAQTAK
jgi:hypothetical protein